MKPVITWNVGEGIEMPDLDFLRLQKWIADVARAHDRVVAKLNYIFCDDEEILRVNREFLRHDYFTDIITFDYSRGSKIAGEMYISLDTVRSNAALVGQSYNQELMRVIIHGVLHLCGIDDKGPGERVIMEAHEDSALDLLNGNL